MMEAIMNSQLNRTPLESFDRETVDEVPANAVVRAQGCRVTGEIIAAGAGVVKESQLYSVRGNAASIILLIGFGAFSLLSIMASWLANPPVSPGMTVVEFLHSLLVISVTAGAAKFAARRLNTPRREGL